MKAMVAAARGLVRVNLGGTGISNAGLRCLLESECAGRLEFLGLAGCAYLTSLSTQGGIVDLSTACPSLKGAPFAP